MNQQELDTMSEALRSQGLTWSQTNFAVSLVRNAVDAEREQAPQQADFDKWMEDRYPDRGDRQSEFRMTSVLDLMRAAFECGLERGACGAMKEGDHFMSQDRDTVSVHAIRAIAVEAIREATGCPDIKGNDGEYLVDKMERLAMLAARGA